MYIYILCKNLIYVSNLTYHWALAFRDNLNCLLIRTKTCPASRILSLARESSSASSSLSSLSMRLSDEDIFSLGSVSILKDFQKFKSCDLLHGVPLLELWTNSRFHFLWRICWHLELLRGRCKSIQKMFSRIARRFTRREQMSWQK